MNLSKGLRQAYDAQDFAHEALMSLREGLVNATGKVVVDKEAASSIALLIRAWQSAQEQVRVHRNKPLPGSLRPAGKAKGAANDLGG